MDFKEQAMSMLIDLGQNYTDERHRELIHSLGLALAKTFALISNHDEMHSMLEKLCEAIQLQACEEHQLLHPDQEDADEEEGEQAVSYETFLRDIFKPTHMND